MLGISYIYIHIYVQAFGTIPGYVHIGIDFWFYESCLLGEMFLFVIRTNSQ